MKVLIIGAGGREHAVAVQIAGNISVEKIWCAPGNGGTAQFCENLPIAATDLESVLAFCRENRPDFAIVTPDDPLALGMVDLLESNGFPCFGPTQAAARLEWSKAYAKDFMQKYHIPTAQAKLCNNAAEACAYVEICPLPVVLKADGLAQGKGVIIAHTRAEAVEGQRLLSEGRENQAMLFEELLTGPEFSAMCFVDGETVVPMPAAQDHKRAYDNDEGPNTGGMGAYSPVPAYTDEIAEWSMDSIFLPTVRGIAQEGAPFKGILYFSLMLTPNGPKVIEYNARFGDPETQAVLPLLRSDLLNIMQAVRAGRLGEIKVKFAKLSSACVVVASGGYPGTYEKGMLISGLDRAAKYGEVYHAGTAATPQGHVTSGGRVLCLSVQGRSLKAVLRRCYEGVSFISFKGAFYRHDIGKSAIYTQGEE